MGDLYVDVGIEPELPKAPLPPLPEGDCARLLERGPASESPGTFAVVLSCIDGRIQRPLAEWVCARFGVAYADVVTAPGIDAVIADGEDAARQALVRMMCVSRLAHHSARVVLAGHHDCAANPDDRAGHEAQIERAVAYLRAMLPRVEFTGVYVDETWSPCAVGAARAEAISPAPPPR